MSTKYIVENCSLPIDADSDTINEELSRCAKNIAHRLSKIKNYEIVDEYNKSLLYYSKNKEGNTEVIKIENVCYTLHTWVPNKSHGGKTKQYELSIAYIKKQQLA